MSRRSLVVTLIACAVMMGWSQPVRSRDVPGASRITAIEVRIDAPPGRVIDWDRQLRFAVGDRLDGELIRATVLELYATGVVDEVDVLTRPDGAAGVVVSVVLTARPWVERARVVGAPDDLAEALSELTRGLADRAVDDSAIIAMRARVLDRLTAAGYPTAAVAASTESIAPARAEVVFAIQSGSPAVVGTVDFIGDLGVVDEPKTLIEALVVKSGEPYRPERVEGNRDALRGVLAESGHLAASVGAPVETWLDGGDRVDLTYDIDAGPVIDLQCVGVSCRRLERRGLLPDGVWRRELLAETCASIRTYYQRRGFYRAQVQCSESAGSQRTSIQIRVEPGERHRVTRLTLSGERFYDDERLLALIATEVGSSWRPGSGRLVDEDLAADLRNLRSFYRLEGFADAEVWPSSVTDLGGGELAVEIPIEAGVRRRVVRFEVDGAMGGASLDGLPLSPGGPFHPVLLDETIRELVARHEALGHRDTTILPTLSWNDDETLVDIQLAVDPGLQQHIGRLLVRGHRYTRESTIRRFSGLAANMPLGRQRLLAAERELYQLGVFSQVEVEVLPSGALGGARDVRITVDEAERWRLGYGVSYDSESGLGGLLSVSRLNVGGRGGRLQLDLRANKDDQRYRLLWDQPTLGRWRIPLTASLFRQQEDREAFDVVDRGVQVALRRELDAISLALVAEYRLVSLTDEVLDPSGLPRDERDLQIASVAPLLFIDQRDDPVDPTRGWTTTLQLEWAFPLFDAETELTELFWQQSAYWPAGDLGVLASSARIGMIEPLNDTVEADPLVPAGRDSGLIPVSERFFAGGRTSHRAWERDRLGVPGETLITLDDGRRLPVGGNTLLLLNLDWRFPISGPVGGTLFADWGNVWADVDHFDIADGSLGLGVGMRYQSPIGPLRLDVGWKLDAPADESNPVLFLSLGNPF
ncbi:MAG: BamA/TamA family outer membrane protein [Acidobacteriota bacterium]